MAHSAGRVERRIRADIPAVGQSLDTGVRLGDAGAEAVHDRRQTFIVILIMEDAGLLGDGLVNLALSFFGRVIVLDLLAQGRFHLEAADDIGNEVSLDRLDRHDAHRQ